MDTSNLYEEVCRFVAADHWCNVRSSAIKTRDAKEQDFDPPKNLVMPKGRWMRQLGFICYCNQVISLADEN